ncbi:MAG: protein translocase subunit SecF [Candidatus Magasanikbacteria bacterium]|nr:protein translocase subunit SecF [Candidatus Magasanikbacteria bacterium]
MIPFVKYAKYLLAVSTAVTIISFASLFVWGLKPSIDFTGGSLLEVSFSGAVPDNNTVATTMKSLGQENVLIQKTNDNKLIIRTAFLDENQHQTVLKGLRAKFETKDNKVNEDQFETIGAAVSSQLRQRSIIAVILVVFSIVAFVAYAFRGVSFPVASWKYGVTAIIAAMHDVVLVVGVFAFLGHFHNVEVDIGFVVALLTVMGYSVQDTIVVYDRIRENLLHRRSGNFSEMVDIGLIETLMRSINTTLITMIPLTALYLLGGSSIHNFALALLVGIASGAYSSIFVASPLLAYVDKYQNKKK